MSEPFLDQACGTWLVPDINPAAPCPLDRVNRQFHAPRPNALCRSDFTYVATWEGFVYVAIIIDAYARRIGGWRVSRTAYAAVVLDPLERALAAVFAKLYGGNSIVEAACLAHARRKF